MKKFRTIFLRFFDARRVIIGAAIIALLADFIANEKPLVASYEGEVYFPILKSYQVNYLGGKWEKEIKYIDWKTANCNWIVRTPIPYSHNSIDYYNLVAVSPFASQEVPSRFWHHWLGTDKNGRDVLANIIHGTRVAFFVGIFAMLIASVIGISIGGIAGYFGDYSLKLSVSQIVLLLFFLPFAWFYAFQVQSVKLSAVFSGSAISFLLQMLFSLLIFTFITSIAIVLGKYVARWLGSKKITIPIDLIISRIIEVFSSIPLLFFIFAFLTLITEPSITLVVITIGFTGWTGIAKLTRGALLQEKEKEYGSAAKALGYSHWQISVKHLLPNAFKSIYVALAYGVANAILIEATLSFLGLSKSDVVTWGSMISEAGSNAKDWWLAVFPGACIFILVMAFNALANKKGRV